MAERSTATSPSQPPAGGGRKGKAAAGKGEQPSQNSPEAPSEETSEQAPEDSAKEPPELHSGHRLSRRYRLEECITRLDGFSSWRAVDEKLRRAVGVHVLPADHERAGQVIKAARSAATMSDARFVQVLDAADDGELVYVIHEWLSDATPLGTVLASGPLEAHEAYTLVCQLAEGMSEAHRKDLAHLRLNPTSVLRTSAGQFRIRGLAVDAALRGITGDDARRVDTQAIGALLYASLTQRWPSPEGGYGLSGVAGLRGNSRDSLASPEQVRAGVHRGLSELAMRALINEGATAASHKPPCTSPEELLKAIGEMPRIRPPEPDPGLLAAYGHNGFQNGPAAAPGPAVTQPAGAAAPPALPGRTGKILKWGVSALLIAALGLSSWQIADALMKGDPAPKQPPVSQETTDPEDNEPQPTAAPVEVAAVHDFDPWGDGQDPDDVANVLDGDPETYWQTANYFGPSFGNLKEGVGLLLDLGESRSVSAVEVSALGGDHPMQLMIPSGGAGQAGGSGTLPSSLDQFTPIAEESGTSITLATDQPVDTRYLLVWLTDLPQGTDGNYRGRITEIRVTG
ncbi:protein kinase family protein [Streptomyces sp. YIM 98790]|uniref:protein kinase family protein n=1 Tax=Streptomyces sp. YIM 98790 TaxID=2689077 RepID=UPI001408E989|nr:protein kinase family protein [Streptomyces sp. YIM 98790]